MYKLYDYICIKKSCKLYEQPVELFVEDKYLESQFCELCDQGMVRILSPVKGYVKGTTNPCKV